MSTHHLHLLILLITSATYSYSFTTQAQCKTGCKLAYASYLISQNSNLTYISTIFSISISNILKHNPSTIIPTKDFLQLGSKIHIPFSCECLNFDFLGHTFLYTVQPGDTYHNIASLVFVNLTTEDWIQRVNSYDPHELVDGLVINVTVNCSCGDASVSKDYGLFATYPLGEGENVSSVADQFGLPEALLTGFNPGFDGSGRIFVPAKDIHGKYPPLKTSKGVITGSIFISFVIFSAQVLQVTGISAAGIVGFIFVAVCLYSGIYKRKKVAEPLLLFTASNDHIHHVQGSEMLVAGGAPSPGITVDKSVEFSYEELAEATDGFSIANKIGQGGFGEVFYAVLKGEKAAIKKMDTQASKEFLAELKVLTHVHHLNLVRLIGYCVEGSLFLVYEYIENGDLGHHLRSSGNKVPLSWTDRVQIALDSARGLEYIHEHTVPMYIHCDIKTANILIDENYRGKVADFGLTKLTEVGSASLQTRQVGTFGYMSPEYAQYGDVTPKIDVYAFGVVLYELISAKEAIVRISDAIVTESKGLVSLFEEALGKPDPKEDLSKLVDSKLGNNYPLDSVYKMAQLAKACTHENPQLRPSMRSIVVALMTLSSTTEDWDVGSFYENQALVSLMSGR